MGLDRIVCLANSYKHDHRCVAGINLATKKWIRLVGRQVPGCLTLKETCYPDGREAAMLDLFDAELGEPCGSNPHPEDVFISGKPWRPVRRFDQPADAQFLAGLVNKAPVALEGFCDRIPASRFERAAAQCSLALVHPDDLWWWIREENGKRRNRALFRLGQAGRVRYDLAVTDPKWLDALNLLPAGIHPHALLCGGKTPKTFLTISLSEPFEGFHYKLAAGVVCLPAQQPA
jgi:hypothetical protein